MWLPGRALLITEYLSGDYQNILTFPFPLLIMFQFIMSVESNLKISNSRFDSEENTVEVCYRHFEVTPLLLLGDHKPPGGVTAHVGLQGLFKDLMEFMNNKSDEISLGAGVLLLSNLVKVALTF